MRKKILIVFGTRPEAIKMAPVIKQLRSCSHFKTEVCVTAQHRHMLDQVLDIFGIKPDYDLNIMQKGQNLFDITVKALTRLKTILMKIRPDILLVQGDTTTTFVASLVAFYLKIPVAHVEAGLRTHNKYLPFPEEINRRLVAEIADFNFAPTLWARNNLLKQGVPKSKIFVTGNTVVDAFYAVFKLINTSRLRNQFRKKFSFVNKRNRKIILITGHRRESFGRGFSNICNAIKELAKTFPECDFVYPVHLNPNVRGPVWKILNQDKLSNVHLIEPLDYLPFVYLMQKAYLVLTDSGGIQEEAVIIGKPILVMRNVTERPEGVKSGVAKLVGVNKNTIIKECKRLITDEKEYHKMAVRKKLYGDGKASQKIVDILVRKLS